MLKTNNKKENETGQKTFEIPRIVKIVVTDLALAAVFLNIYAVFHHVAPITNEMESIVIENNTEFVEPADIPIDKDIVENTKLPKVNEEADSKSYNPLYEKFKDKFTDGETIVTDNSYISDSIHISIDKVEDDLITYYVADVYLANIEDFKTGFSHGEYRSGERKRTQRILSEHNGILGISGDYYNLRIKGLVIRNGVLYRKSVEEDVLIMYYDGSMETIKAEDVRINDLVENGAYQSWSFGPILLEDGQPITTYATPINARNPRSAIGYYEPGHYALVVVDGRQEGYSIGVTLKELSQIFYDLGCVEAYNLDGGQTAAMAFYDELISHPPDGGRFVSDIIYIGERDTESETNMK